MSGIDIISLDCETNGLGGLAFAAAATLTKADGQEADRWEARCPIVGPVDPWVAENVLPALGDMPETRDDYEDLLDGWRGWYRAARECAPEAAFVVHVLWPVEAQFLFNAHYDDLFTGPYPIDDVAPLLRRAGHDPTSVDAYLAAHGLPVPEGSPHHPLYDVRAAVTAYRHLMAGAR